MHARNACPLTKQSTAVNPTAPLGSRRQLAPSLRPGSSPSLLASNLTSGQGSWPALCRFMVEDLKNVDRSHTPWVIVGGHRPFYIDSTNAMPGQGDCTVAAALQDALEAAFVEHGVRKRMPLLFYYLECDFCTNRHLIPDRGC